MQRLVEKSKQSDKPLLIYFTGFAAVNCRKMETAINNQSDLLETITEDYIFIPLAVDHKTELKKEFWKKSKLNPRKTLKRIGAFNNELQILLTQSGSQPYFAILNDEGEVSSEIGYCKDISDFQTFLKN